MEMMRLHRYIAQSGLTSRRKAEEMIAEGRVAVNGVIVTEQGVKVGDTDLVSVDGRNIGQMEKAVYVMNKPKGVVTTMDDPQGRQTVLDLMPPSAQGAKPVGRLDRDTEGLLLLTTDGELAARLTHPRHGVEKEYVAIVEGIPSEDALDRLRRGVYIEGRRTGPIEVVRGGIDDRRGRCTLTLILHEGRNRQVRRMCEAVGHPVRSLRRVRIGSLVLKGMQPGEVRLLSKKQLEQLRRLVGLEG